MSKMKRKFAIWIFVFFILIAQAVISSDLFCYITNSTCDEATLLYMKNDSDGYNNAHAQLPNQTEYYDYRICCNSSLQNISNECGTPFLRLSNVTNAHVQDPSQSFDINYNYNACISSEGTIKCRIYSGSCPSNYECLASIASSEGDNYTNAHISQCDYYNLNVCCYSNNPPTQTNPILNATDNPLNRTNANLTCYNQSTYDADGDIVYNIFTFKRVENQYTLLNIPFEANESCGTNCTREYASGNNFSKDSQGNMPVWVNNSIVNGSMLFYGGEALQSSSTIAISSTQNFTVECWINTTSSSNNTCFSILSINLLSRWNGFAFGIVGGKASYSQWKNDYIGANPQQINGTSLINDGKPHHIAIVNDNNLTIYVDGIPENSVTDVKNISVSTFGMIGAMVESTLPRKIINYFNGTIDQVMLFNSSLSQCQIRNHYLKKYDEICYNETYHGQIWACYVTPTDTIDDGFTLQSNLLEIENTPPVLSSAMILPEDPKTNDTLTCLNGISSDDDNDNITYIYNWYNGSQWLNINNQNLSQSYTLYGQYWNCSVTPYDGYDNGTTYYSNKVFINNTIPTTPILLTPENGNETLFWRNVTFSWNASYDPDVDEGTQSLIYEINITSSTCPNHFETNIQSTTYTLPYDLECVNKPYFWKVRAYDGISYSEWSETFNFTIEPTIIINLTQDTISYGSKLPGDIDDTTDNNPEPMLVENQGNIDFDTRLYASDGLWDSVPLNRSNFQAKVRATSENNSFNISSERTKLEWINITGINPQDFVYIIGGLKYVDESDTAFIDTRIQVPLGEYYGAKSSTLMFIGEPVYG